MDYGSIFVILESEEMWKKVDRACFKSFYKDIIWGVHSFLVIPYSVAWLH